MRVIAGVKRGTKLYTLEGSNTRPTLDRVKQSLFSMIQYEIKDAVCLDAYAGSGSLGIEALSRGVSFVDFVDVNKSACQIISKNLEKTALTGSAVVVNKDALTYIKQSSKIYDLVFFDPPYAKNLVLKPFEELLIANKLSEDALIVIEHPSDENYDEFESLYGVSKYKTKKFGSKQISIFRR